MILTLLFEKSKQFSKEYAYCHSMPERHPGASAYFLPFSKKFLTDFEKAHCKSSVVR